MKLKGESKMRNLIKTAIGTIVSVVLLNCSGNPMGYEKELDFTILKANESGIKIEILNYDTFPESTIFTTSINGNIAQTSRNRVFSIFMKKKMSIHEYELRSHDGTLDEFKFHQGEVIEVRMETDNGMKSPVVSVIIEDDPN